MREIGHRRPRHLGTLRAPTQSEREWVAKMSKHETQIPKGVFRYRSHQEANRDWEKWHVEQMVKVAHERKDGDFQN